MSVNSNENDTVYKKEENTKEENTKEENEYETFRFHPLSGWDEENNTWRCIECGVSMGPNNPRQLCGKSRCLLR